MNTSSHELSIAQLEDQGAILEIQDGNHGESHPKSSEYIPAGIPFVMASDLREGFLDLETCKFLPKQRTDRLRIGFARTGDVLLSRKGSVGRVAIVPEFKPYVMLTPQVTYYRVDESKLSSQLAIHERQATAATRAW
jgi:type I restriction enzyme S subunit